MAIEQYLTPKGVDFFKQLEPKIVQNLFELVDEDSETILKTIGAVGFFVSLKSTFDEDIEEAIKNLDSGNTKGGEIDASKP